MTEYNGLHNKNDIIGEVYNKWTVLSYSHKHTISGNWYSPFPAELIYHGVGEGEEEEFWHNIFKHRHHKGEWFYMPVAGQCEV